MNNFFNLTYYLTSKNTTASYYIINLSPILEELAHGGERLVLIPGEAFQRGWQGEVNLGPPHLHLVDIYASAWREIDIVTNLVQCFIFIQK